MRRTTVAIVLAALGSGSAWAQEPADANRLAVSVVGGLSVGSGPSFGRGRGFSFYDIDPGSDAGFAVGAGIAYDLSPRLTLEANGLYLDRDASAWNADAGLRLNFAPSGRSVVPYFAVSGGVYSERVDADLDLTFDRFIRDPRRSQLPVRFTGGFREIVRAVEASGLGSFDDVGGLRRTYGLLTLGGGVRLASGSHVFVRPDVRAQVVFGDDTRVLGLFTLNFGYRF